MAPKLLIIADDLTGALDSAAPFAALGRDVRVARRPAALDGLAGAEVAAVATATREGSAEEAVAVIEALAGGVARLAPERVMKKVDSRLKGHVAAETGALAALLGARTVLACPAVPDQGRRVEGGALVGTGVADPIRVAERFRGAAELVLTPDAAEDADLDALVADVAPDMLLAGARGLAAALAWQMGPGQAARPAPLGRPLRLAIGSRDPITLAQVAELAGMPGLVHREAPDGLLPPGDPADCTLLQMTGTGLDPAAGSRFAGAVAAELGGVATLFACGGETADAVLGAAGIDLLHLLGEPFPGLPWSRADGPGGPIDILTKSGGFGGPDLLRRLVHRLAERAVRTQNDALCQAPPTKDPP